MVKNCFSLYLGKKIIEYLEDDYVTEISVNEQGQLFIFHKTLGWQITSEIISVSDRYRLIMATASELGVLSNEENPFVSGMLPAFRSRFQAVLPPIVYAPIWIIRKHLLSEINLETLIEKKAINKKQYSCIQELIRSEANILIIGGTNSGKTTLLNALLQEKTSEFPLKRVVILEDTQEIYSHAKNKLQLWAKPPTTLGMLLKVAMRLTPEVLVMGEIRGSEAYDFIKLANSGHHGTYSTLHADDPVGAVHQLIQYCQENPACIQSPLLMILNLSLWIFVCDIDENNHRFLKGIFLVKSNHRTTHEFVVERRV